MVTDGPYGETKELFGGFCILDVASKEEAVEWAKRVPAVPGSKIEIRRVAGHRRVPAGQRVDPQGAGVAREHRPALMGTADVEAVWRIESARIVGALARYTGDFALAEDVAQEAVAEALVSWPRDGVPGQPGRLAADHGPAAGDRRVPPPVRPRRAVRRCWPAEPGGATGEDDCCGTPTGSTTTSSR